MSVYRDRRGVTYRYDFEYRGRRYRGSTGQTTIRDAKEVEGLERQKIRHLGAGLVRRQDSPRFSEWAGTYYRYAETRVRRPIQIKNVLNMVLRFWGAAPPPDSGVTHETDAPYHNLRLVDPVDDPDWIERFETWMHSRSIGPQTRNHYRSIMRRMYRVAMHPRFRKQTGITVNPFLGYEKERVRRRSVTIGIDELRKWVAKASYHVRLAVAIGALAPKLRLANILALQWDDHLDEALTLITVWDHKTVDDTGDPLVVPVSEQLQRILVDARRRRPDSRYVVSYRGRPVKGIRAGVTNAAVRAGVKYGRDVGGVTFHTLRHIASTELAKLAVPIQQHQHVMGHGDVATTMAYTHLQARDQIEPLEQLSAAIPLEDLVTQPRLRAVGGKVGGP